MQVFYWCCGVAKKTKKVGISEAYNQPNEQSVLFLPNAFEDSTFFANTHCKHSMFFPIL